MIGILPPAAANPILILQSTQELELEVAAITNNGTADNSSTGSEDEVALEEKTSDEEAAEIHSRYSQRISISLRRMITAHK
jgi:hypothetical protein